MATVSHPLSGEPMEGRELLPGDTIEPGDLCAVFGGEWVEWPEQIDHVLTKEKQMTWVRPNRS
jgi:hypothetical protein